MCFRRFNGTNQIGCSCKYCEFQHHHENGFNFLYLSGYFRFHYMGNWNWYNLFTAERGGNVGVFHYIENQTDVDWLVTNGTHKPYIVLLTPEMFNRYHELQLNFLCWFVFSSCCILSGIYIVILFNAFNFYFTEKLWKSWNCLRKLMESW